MQENLFWTEKIVLGTIRDPLQLAVFRFPDQYFLTGITTQTQRIRYYTFLTWAWNQIKEKKSDTKKIIELEKILALVSAQHHENGGEPGGIRSIGNAKEGAKKFLLENSQIDVEKFTSFGRRIKGTLRYGYGEYYHRGPLANLFVVAHSNTNELIISPAGKEISTIFSEYIGNIKDKIWSKTLTKSDLQTMTSLCCCSIPTEEQNFWINVFFGLTTLEKDGLKIDHEKQLEILDPDRLSFEKFKISEYEVAELSKGEVTEDDSILDGLLENQKQLKEDPTAKNMRRGTLFLLLEIIKNSKPREKLYQTIRDSIYYSQFQVKDKILPINFNKLESYRKYWEVYVHSQYYVTIFEKTLSIIIDICKHNPSGIEIDKLVSKIDSQKFLDSIRKRGLQISDSDNVQTVYEQLENIIGGKKTTLSSPINEHDLLEKIQNASDKTETLGLIFVLFLLCKYRYSSFHEDKELRILDYKHDKFQNIFPKTKYDEFSKIPVTEFPERLLKFVIKRYRLVTIKKYYSNGTKAWLFTVDNDILYFNPDQKKQFEFNAYRDTKWDNVLEIMNDLGLIQKNPDKKNWEITKEGEEWLKKIQ